MTSILFAGLERSLANADVSAAFEVQNDQPIIVERAMYSSTQGRTFNAGHDSAGVTAAATTWFLAEGATGEYFDLFLPSRILNHADAQVTVTYLLPDGQTLSRALIAPSNTRLSIWVDWEQFHGVEGFPLADVEVSARLTSTNGVPISSSSARCGGLARRL